MATATELKQVERILKALANRRRLAILSYLRRAREANVGQIAREIKLSLRSTSRHIALLSGAGLLEKEQRINEVFYRLASPFSAVFVEYVFLEL